jgi:hypothetical protein
VITFFAVTLSEGSRQAVLRSYSGKFIAQVTQRAGPAIPREIRDVLGKHIDRFERRLEPDAPPDEPLEKLKEEIQEELEELKELEEIEQFLRKADLSPSSG